MHDEPCERKIIEIERVRDAVEQLQLRLDVGGQRGDERVQILRRGHGGEKQVVRCSLWRVQRHLDSCLNLQ